MKQTIESTINYVFNAFSISILKRWQNERYYFVKLDNSMITYVVLNELISRNLEFVIDLNDCAYSDAADVLSEF